MYTLYLKRDVLELLYDRKVSARIFYLGELYYFYLVHMNSFVNAKIMIFLSMFFPLDI
jgi:hypothetical protein